MADLQRTDHRQGPQGLAKHRAADAQSRGQLALRQQAIARFQRAGQELFAQKRNDPVVAALVFNRFASDRHQVDVH